MVVGRVEEGGVGDTQGVNEGDEVVLINDTSVLELGWEGVGSELQGSELQDMSGYRGGSNITIGSAV